MRERLARLRVPLGFAFGGFVVWLADPSGRSLGVGVPVAMAGEGLRIWASGHLRKSQEVTASGPYRWLAHPLYVGSSVMGAGLALACGSVVAAVAIGLYLAVTLTAAIRSEEAHLRRLFGDRYDRFRHRGEVDATRRFRLAQVVENREQRTVGGLALAVLLLALKASYNGAFWRAAETWFLKPGG